MKTLGEELDRAVAVGCRCSNGRAMIPIWKCGFGDCRAALSTVVILSLMSRRKDDKCVVCCSHTASRRERKSVGDRLVHVQDRSLVFGGSCKPWRVHSQRDQSQLTELRRQDEKPKLVPEHVISNLADVNFPSCQ